MAIFLFPSSTSPQKNAVAKQKGSNSTHLTAGFSPVFFTVKIYVSSKSCNKKGSEVSFIVSMEFHFETSGNFGMDLFHIGCYFQVVEHIESKAIKVENLPAQTNIHSVELSDYQCNLKQT